MPAKDALEYVIYNDSALCTGSYILNNIFPTLYDAAVFLNLFFKIGKLGTRLSAILFWDFITPLYIESGWGSTSSA